MRARLVEKSRVRASWTGIIAAVALAWFGFAALRAAGGDPSNTGMADPAALVAAYDRFTHGGSPANVVVLSLSNLRGLSSEAINAGGRVVVDLEAGTVSSSVQLLPPDGTFDLWLIDNRPGTGHTTLAQQGDAQIKVGAYVTEAGSHTLSVSLGSAALTGFFPDRAFVVRSGDSPVDRFVLTGPTTLFERLRHRQVRFVDNPSARQGFNPGAGTRLAGFEKVIAEGRKVFVDETFNGNGRTCGTCHVESNNFTVDPALIATLPSNDPLFVADNNPALAGLENSDLLRRFGLFLVNADGIDPARGFVLRSAQNVQALANSTTPQDPISGNDFSTNGRNPDPPERLGWGNDGPPLRDFALVAIAQHAPTTMSRLPGVDFRVPTDEELDALAAYQLALGRQQDFTLPTLELRSALASSGKTLFLDSGNLFEPAPGHKNCNGCHFNGGGTAGMSFNPATPGFPDVDGSPQGFSLASPTNVDDVPLALALGLPRDGGFGQIPTVESADTAPFFHNHTVPDLESAVAFYGTPAFKASLIAGAIPIDISPDPADPEVQAIAAFLRVLNALENIRSSIDVAERGRTMIEVDDVRDLSRLALAEVDDAIDVLSQGAFAGQNDSAIRSATTRLRTA